MHVRLFRIRQNENESAMLIGVESTTNPNDLSASVAALATLSHGQITEDDADALLFVYTNI